MEIRTKKELNDISCGIYKGCINSCYGCFDCHATDGMFRGVSLRR